VRAGYMGNEILMVVDAVSREGVEREVISRR
jgi:hypothetical protein